MITYSKRFANNAISVLSNEKIGRYISNDNGTLPDWQASICVQVVSILHGDRLMNILKGKDRSIKRFVLIILRIIGCCFVVEIIGVASNFLYEMHVQACGAGRFVGNQNVIYTGELWEFIYTNPMAMFGRYLFIFIGIAIAILLLDTITIWCIQKWKFFPKIGKFDKFLIIALVFSLVACAYCGGTASATNVACSKQYQQVKVCQTLSDYEKLLGKPLFEGTIQEEDKEWIKAFGIFDNDGGLPVGFVPGRKLVVFGMEYPKVYMLVWMENGQIVGRNGCYKDAPIPK